MQEQARNVPTETGKAGAWAGRSVLVTGAGGFIGSHLVEQLVGLGAKVRAFLRYTSQHDVGNLRFLDPACREQLELVYGDLCHFSSVRDAAKGVDTIFHLAASISIPYSYTLPEEMVETNIKGTMNVMLAAREAGVRRVVLTSSSEVYGTAQYVPIDEQHPLQPQSPYAASKVAADMIGLSFYRTYELPIAILRPFNTYGPRQSMRAVIPTIISQALTQETIQLGALHPMRDFVYVEDAVRAFLLAALNDAVVGEVVHVGCGATISISELTKDIIGIIGRRVQVTSDEDRLRPEMSEVLRLQADPSKAARLLGWTPEISLQDGLRRTVSWIADHLEEFDPTAYYI